MGRVDDTTDDVMLIGADVVASFNVADMQAGARRFGIGVERPGVVMRRIDR